MVELISFDIDGTLETGSGPGPITLDMVRLAREMGYIIGSCSDRPISAQRSMWEKHGIPVEFTVNKHKLDDVKAKFEADVYYHIGDTNIDEAVALAAGFRFFQVQTMDRTAWMGEIPWGPDGRTVPANSAQPQVEVQAPAEATVEPAAPVGHSESGWFW